MNREKGTRCGINETRWHCSSQEEWNVVEAQHSTLAAKNWRRRLWCEMKSGAEVTARPREKVLHERFGALLYRTTSRLWIFGRELGREPDVIEAVQLVYLNLILLRVTCFPHLTPETSNLSCIASYQPLSEAEESLNGCNIDNRWLTASIGRASR